MRGRYGDSKSLSVLTVSAVAGQIRATFAGFEDRRRGKNTPYSLSDAALSAFSVFFMQSPSFLDFPRTMQETLGKSNAQTLFGVYRIPCDNPIRSLLDAVAPSSAYPLFPSFLTACNRRGSWIATGRRGSACCWRSMEWSIFLAKSPLYEMLNACSWGLHPLFPHGDYAGSGLSRTRQSHPLTSGVHRSPGR